MLGPIARTYGPHPAPIVCVSLPEYFDTDDKLARHVDVLREHGGTASEQVGALAAHSFLNLVMLLTDALEILTQAIDVDMNIS